VSIKPFIIGPIGILEPKERDWREEIVKEKLQPLSGFAEFQ